MSSIGADESPDVALRKERAAIAAQACQTCRNRKSKCDEQRPKCGLCRRLNVECSYREPQPTKKDKTMVHILEALQRLESKFDTFALSTSSTPASGQTNTPPQTNTSNRSQSHGESSSQFQDADERADARVTAQEDYPKELQRSYRHLTAAHKVILWPAIYLHIMDSNIAAADDLKFVLQDGTPWFISLELRQHPLPLPCDAALRSFPMPNPRPWESRTGFFNLTVDAVGRLTEAYFNTFNSIHPILNRDMFLADLERLMRTGFADGDIFATLALFVLALGQVAIDGAYGAPVSSTNGVPSGLRGGTVERPPGLDIFNEGRRRIGFIMAQCDLENVQIHLLQATYYEACARHLDFWRSTVAASMACQVLIRCQAIDWSTPRADLIKRAYWACILSEDLYHLDMDLAQTGIHTLEDQVPLPYFHEIKSDYADGRSHFQYHFLAMIALRRLITRIHGSIHENSASAEASEDYGGPPIHVIKELGRQLDSLRSLLPRQLQWSDSDKFDFSNVDHLQRRPADALFALDEGPVRINHPYNLDIVTGQLRTRFYYARFMIYRPFLYKALHFSELMTQEDANGCALAIQSACLWPLSMAPPKNKKRLVPHLFTWTQNFIGILLILRMTTVNDCLRTICDELVSKQDVERTIDLMLDWLRDMKQMDGIADWSWKILQPLFAGHDATLNDA